MKYHLPELPYSRKSFEGFLSEESFDFHYDKHHRAYVEKLNELLPDSPYAGKDLEEILFKPKDVEEKLFNNAAQAWNHTFYWHSLRPGPESAPTGAIAESMAKVFPDLKAFREEWIEKGVAQFGSGWIWLVQNDELVVSIVTTSDAENPLSQGLKPLACHDVWEHAYYIDHRNDRKKFLEQALLHTNWEFANRNLMNSRTPRMGDLMRR